MKRSRRQFLYLAAGFAALSACARLFWPQTYPTRPVRIVVGVPPDGPLNLSARLMGQTVWAVALLAGCLLPPGLSAQEVAGNARIRITLGEPKQVLTYRKPDALGLFNVPDMHTAVLQRPDKSFLLWITGNVGPSAGSVARLSTTDFLHYENAGPGTATRAEPVMVPSCRADAQRVARPVPSCLQNPDADYVGANFVMSTGNGQDLVMFYEAGNKSIGDKTIGHGWEYNVTARARSTDNGVTWKREDVILSGADPKPTERTDLTQPGISEPGAIVANGYIYMFYQYVPNLSSAPDAPSAIQMARAPLEGGGAAGTWMKYDQGSFSQPGVGGSGSPIVGTGGSSGCTRPVEVWPAFSTYLNAYVLTFLCNEGWFFSTSTDLVAWTAPVNFMPMKMWQPCQPMDWNYVLVTPGSQAGVIGRTGYVLYAHTDRRGMDCSNRFSPHMLWVRPFSFEKAP
jgi:hypothetical protein